MNRTNLNVIKYCLKDTTERIIQELKRTQVKPSDTMLEFLATARSILKRLERTK